MTTAELHEYEASMGIVAGPSEGYLSAATGAKSEYSVTPKATDGNEFKISRNALGEVSRNCVSPVMKTGCAGAETGTW